MNSDDDILIQGDRYEPEDIDMEKYENKSGHIPIGSNPDGIYDPNAFHVCIDDLIEDGLLHTKNGILIKKRIGSKYYDKFGNII